MASTTEHSEQGRTGALPADVVGVLTEARENLRLKRLAFARELELAAHFADVTGWVADESVGLPGVERLVRVGHEGTPEISEFSSLEYAAALHLSREAAERMISDSLDLRHRLPGLWALTMSGELDVWKAREIVQLTSCLAFEACLRLDRELSAQITALPWTRVVPWVRAMVLEALPDDEAEARQAAAMERRHVEIGQSVLGVTDVDATVSAADAIHLDAILNWLAEILRAGGNERSRDVRRAQALGVLATPARALQLLQASLLDQLPDDLDDECPRQGAAGHTCGAITVDPEKLLPRSELVVHLTESSLAEQSGLVRLEGLGPMLAEWTAELVGHHRIKVSPVIDANHLAPVDAYECPAAMRRAVELRNPVEVFPWSSRKASRCDLDHSQPYVPGREGQTRPENLAPLGRRVHRAKTHGRWRLQHPVPGSVVWTSPAGFTYLVTPSGTHELHVPTRPLAPRKADWGVRERPPATSSRRRLPKKNVGCPQDALPISS